MQIVNQVFLLVHFYKYQFGVFNAPGNVNLGGLALVLNGDNLIFAIENR